MSDNLYPEDAERAVLGSLIKAPHMLEAVAERLQPDDFTGQHTALAGLLWKMYGNGDEIDPQTFLARVIEERPIPVDQASATIVRLIEAAWNPLSAAYYADVIAKAVRRRRLRDVGRRIEQYVETADPVELASSALEDIGGVLEDRQADNQPSPMAESLEQVSTTYEWIFPRLLEIEDRLLITAPEGSGKSIMVRQLAVCAAAGLHPFTGDSVKPRRVLLVDCENSQRQSRRHILPLLALAEKLDHPVQGRLRIQLPSGGLDLTRSKDAMWLLNRATIDRPELLCVGPLYRLSQGDPNDERDARKVAAAIDAARLRAGAALITETHAGHGQGLGRERDLRPKGSQLWRAWPEMIRALRPGKNEQWVAVEKAGRGDRDRRIWPEYLRWGDLSRNEWPWHEISEIEYQAGSQ